MGAMDHCLADLVRNHATDSPRRRQGGRLSPRRLARAIDYMQAHLGEDVSVGQIAAAANLSLFHFSRVFRNTTGISPYRYLLQCRVDRVRELLSIDDRPLAEIAVLTGFADQSHMTNIFKRVTGVPPMRYRRDVQESLVRADSLPERKLHEAATTPQ